MSEVHWELAPKLTVPTSHGPVEGLRREGMHQFLGVPYAAPPVGELRWRPPQPPAAWKLPRDAFAYGPVAAQNNRSFPGFAFSSTSEDCLYLNVFAREGVDESSRLPVMFWIPGGGLFMGGSTGYDPAALVTQGEVVLVSINYRVSVFGFFSHPAINAEDHEIGNYGILDQQAALRWVRDNIAGFGGDPDNVTIFGESAGGISVWCQVASPASAGLFHKAIVQSGAATAVSNTPKTRDLEQSGMDLVAELTASEQTSEVLRALPASDLLAANLLPPGTFGLGRFEIGQTVDGVVIPEPMVDLFAAGTFNRVPMINGTNRSEFSWFQAMIELATGMVVPPEAYEEVLAASLSVLPDILVGKQVPPERIAEIIRTYPLESFASAADAIATVISDVGFIDGGNRRTNAVLRQHVDEVFAYEFDVPDSETPWRKVSFPYRSAHTKELQYLFPGFAGGGGSSVAFDDADSKLAAEMVGYWTSFARVGKPGGAGTPLPEWSAYDARRENVMLLTVPECRELDDFGSRHHGDLWDTI